MQLWHTIGRMAAAVAILALLIVGTAGADTLQWDGSDTSTAGAQGGSGTWDASTTANWWNTNTLADQVWSDAGGEDIASFALPGGVVTVSGTVNVNQLLFSTASSGYTFTNGTINLNGAHTLNPGSASMKQYVYSLISGSAGFAVPGNGTLTLYNTNNSYSGGILLNNSAGGLLYFVGDGCLGAVPADALATNLQFIGAAAAPSFNFGIPSGWSGDVTVNSNRTLFIGGNNVTFNFTSSGQNLYLDNRILSTNNVAMTFDNSTGGGTIWINNTANQYAGTNYIGRKLTVKLSKDNALPTNTVLRLVVSASGGSSYGRFDLNGHQQTVAGLLTDSVPPGTATLARIQNSSLSTMSTITVTGASTFDGSLLTGNGPLALTKTGGGRLTLTSYANSYHGLTRIESGTLALSGSGTIASSTGIVLLAGAQLDVTNIASFVLVSNQTLKGEGFVIGDVSAATNSILAPGVVGVGALTVTGNVTMAGVLQADVDGAISASDRLAVSGSLSLGASSVLTLAVTNAASLAAAGFPKLTLASYGGTLTGTFGATNGIPASYTLDYGSRNNGVIALVGPRTGTTILVR